MKDELSSCSGEKRMTRRILRSFFETSRACAYPPSSKNLRSCGPYSSSNSRLNLAEVSRGFKARLPVVLRRPDALVVVEDSNRGRNGKRYVNRLHGPERSLRRRFMGAKSIFRRRGGRRMTSSVCGTIRGASSCEFRFDEKELRSKLSCKFSCRGDRLLGASCAAMAALASATGSCSPSKNLAIAI